MVAELYLVRSMERPPWVTNEEEWIGWCRQIAAKSRDLLENRLGVLEVARQLVALGHSVRAEHDPDFMTFTAIYSESVDLPLGSVRREWAPDALGRKDAEIHALEKRWRDDAFSAARSLVEKYA